MKALNQSNLFTLRWKNFSVFSPWFLGASCGFSSGEPGQVRLVGTNEDRAEKLDQRVFVRTVRTELWVTFNVVFSF